MDVKMSTWRPGTAVCRCCLAEGCYKDISTEYFWMGKREVYAEMLTETFDLNISYSQSGGPNSNSRLICEPCISRLRDASEFKRQVYDCEKMFMQHLEPTGSGIATSTQVEIEPATNKGVKVELVKQEKDDSGDDFFDDRNDFGDDDDDDLDDEPLTNLATKVPKKEKEVDLLDFLDKPAAKKPAAEKRKAAAPPKPKATPVKKAKVVKEAKPSASKDKVVEKKKKDENGEEDVALEHAQLLLRHSTLYPFRLDVKQMIQCLVCDIQKSKCTFDNPKDFRFHFEENHANVDTSEILKARRPNTIWPRVDVTDLRCRLCDDSNFYDSIKTLSDHLNQQHDVKVVAELSPLVPIRLEVDRFVCVVCDKVTATLVYLCSHSGKHFSRYTCDHCDRSFETRNGLIKHLSEQHTAAPVQCKRCKAIVSSKAALKEHIKSSEICLPHACNICRKRFFSYLHREQHLVDVHDKPKKMYPCTECDKVFEKRNALYLHFKATHTDDFKCNVCSRRFDTKRAYTEHTNRHAGIFPFPCPHCMRAFPTEHRFKMHLREHDPSRKIAALNKTGDDTDCPACSYKTHEKSRLKSHIAGTHPEIFEQYYGKDKSKRYCCSVCPYTARVMNRLKLHMKRMHPDVYEKEFANDTKMFYCSACAYKNRLKFRLKTHVEKEHPEIYLQEFPIDESKMKHCTACPYKNLMKCKLKLHVKRCHPEIYEQQFGNARSRFNYCDACPYKIRGDKSLLKLHVKKAHPALFEEEFKPDETKMKRCPACPFKNIQRFRLRTHVKKWHPEIYEREFGHDERKMFDCPVCTYQHFQKCRLKLHVKRRHPELAEKDFKFGV